MASQDFPISALSKPSALFTGFLKPEVAANTGFVRVSRPEAVAEMTQIFAVKEAPYSPDYY